MIDIQQIKQISIRDYLALRGIEPMQQNTRYGLYLSPLREEHSSSFKVDYIQNLWYDFGLGEGGSIIDLVMRMKNCDFMQAVQSLDNGEIKTTASAIPVPVMPTVPVLRILSDAPLHNAALVAYLQSRAIDPATASAYCREVRYTVGGKTFFAVGFRNDAGGWELRNRYFKGCTSKAPTTCRGDYPTCLVFEGFMDFLSYLTLKRARNPPHNIVVLNSVTNLSKAVPFIASHEQVYAYLDNDDAGRKAKAALKAACRNLSDQSVHYRPHNDLNDYLRCRRPVKEHKRSHGRKL